MFRFLWEIVSDVRITKEQISYAKELESQQKRVDKLISEGADEADVRKQKEVLEETVQMIPDVKRRLDTAYQELSTMVVGYICQERYSGPQKKTPFVNN
jgi:hypothetical protein